MRDEFSLVWEGGFPQGTVFIANDAYLLAIDSLEVTANGHYGSIRVVFVPDGEYLSWKEAQGLENLMRTLCDCLRGHADWQECLLTCGFWIDPRLSQKEKENLLLEKYGLFLTEGGINLALNLVPEIRWVDTP